ncbi:hypothetical protein GCM10028824_02560 [Hymenobacter segetis]|uniref:Uncharacterized protein n=1 Tax=Hymenobacter segetis TaxID=2025509 RepID=A0ABU9LSA6_9BACT
MNTAHQTTSPLQPTPADIPAPGAVRPVAAAVVTLTFSRGTRPLSTRRPANGGQHDYRRRSA